ncbi:hypothetical protein UY3_14162 [Chelonia mydas]|uniref:Myb/SANT-like DNA-binding domain-containing protein n=1 Tax=Chelonia mydas TaxID=8469 RepID=M7B056_CHEMY|nr:hypothetical protein UY3_14162 [Chelonia mydas]
MSLLRLQCGGMARQLCMLLHPEALPMQLPLELPLEHLGARGGPWRSFREPRGVALTLRPGWGSPPTQPPGRSRAEPCGVAPTLRPSRSGAELHGPAPENQRPSRSTGAKPSRSQVWSALSESFQVTMPPRARRSPVWSNGEVLDFISVWGEETVQSQPCSSHRNYDTFGQISRDMGHERDSLEWRFKVKELRNAYHKARETNSCSGAAPGTYHFYKELTRYLGVTPLPLQVPPGTLQSPVQQGKRRSKAGVRLLRLRKTPRNP